MLMFLFVSCSDEKEKLKITFQSEIDKIEISGLKDEYEVGETAEAELKYKGEHIDGIQFDIELKTTEIEIEKIELYNLSSENFVSSEKTENNYRIIFFDMKTYLQKDVIFAKIRFKVNYKNDKIIKIKNLVWE